MARMCALQWPCGGRKSESGLPVNCSQERAARCDLVGDLRVAQRRQRIVVEGMVADLVACVDDTGDELGEFLCRAAHDEERRRHVRTVQDVQQNGRVKRIRSVVEGQRDLFAHRVHAPDLVVVAGIKPVGGHAPTTAGGG